MVYSIELNPIWQFKQLEKDSVSSILQRQHFADGCVEFTDVFFFLYLFSRLIFFTIQSGFAQFTIPWWTTVTVQYASAIIILVQNELKMYEGIPVGWQNESFHI